MLRKTVFHTFILTIAVLGSLIFIETPVLSYYSLQVAGFVLLILLISRRFVDSEKFRMIESAVSTIAILMVVSSTGGIGSPLFFLNYILLFELSLLLEPAIPLILSILLILFYLFSGPSVSLIYTVTTLLSFPFMTPLAIFAGNLYMKSVNQKKEIGRLSHKINELKEELVDEEMNK